MVCNRNIGCDVSECKFNCEGRNCSLESIKVGCTCEGDNCTCCESYKKEG